MLVRFIKNWTLPLAMLAGTLGYSFLQTFLLWRLPNLM